MCLRLFGGPGFLFLPLVILTREKAFSSKLCSLARSLSLSLPLVCVFWGQSGYENYETEKCGLEGLYVLHSSVILVCVCDCRAMRASSPEGKGWEGEEGRNSGGRKRKGK